MRELVSKVDKMRTFDYVIDLKQEKLHGVKNIIVK